MRSLRSFAWGSVVGLLLVVGAASAWFEFTPMASVVDTRLTSLLAASAAAILAFWQTRRHRRAASWMIALMLGIVITVTATVLVFAMYRKEDVRFPSGEVELAGTLFRHRDSGTHPAVVFIHGSGRQKRREFEYQAKLFARHGMAALVYDKRGSGESGGRTFDVGYDGYAADVASAIAYLRTRDDIREQCIGIVGHSEGGWVASIVASSLVRDVAFVIVTSSTPLTPAQQVV